MSRQNNKHKKRQPVICCCNSVSKETIELAITHGCKTLSQIFDATQAGVGPCGGSCRPQLKKMLESYLSTGKFPEHPRPQTKKKPR